MIYRAKNLIKINRSKMFLIDISLNSSYSGGPPVGSYFTPKYVKCQNL